MPQSVVLNKNSQAAALAYHFSKRKWKVLEDDYTEVFNHFSSKFDDFQILDKSPDDRWWLIEEMNGGLNWTWLFDNSEGSFKKLFSDHPMLEKYPKVYRHGDVVQSFDGLNLPVQVYLSEKWDQNHDGLPDEKMPAVIYVHGGPWQGWMEDNWLINRHLQLLADRGYVVVYAQYRGALTYGKTFLEKGNQQWGGDMMRDKEAIARWLFEEKNVKKDKIGIFGWSYGGYAALAGAAFTPKTYACAISMYGPTYLDAPREENAFGYSPNSLLRIADVTTEEGLELARKHSPLYAAKDISIPILLSTGSKDERVPQMQMDKMAEALKEEGKDVSYLVYPDEGHDYRNKNSWTTFWAVGEQFLALHLGGKAETIQKEEDFSQVEVKFLSKEIKTKN
jgi:dipeptidyl aminopeptidase/acylaminoacyl peptidase